MDDLWIPRQPQQEDPAPPDGTGGAAAAPGAASTCVVGPEAAALQQTVVTQLGRLEAVLRTEHQVLLEHDAGALTTLARQKMMLLAGIEQACRQMDAADLATWLGEDRALLEALGRCHGLNHINGNLIALRRQQVGRGLDALGLESTPAEMAPCQGRVDGLGGPVSGALSHPGHEAAPTGTSPQIEQSPFSLGSGHLA
jgi:flagellar biosynthesis/type III secretory pathway chaperone